MTTTIYTHPLFFKHQTPQEHPENPQRYEVLLDTLSSFPQVSPNKGNVDNIILEAHTKNHLALIEESLIEDEISCIDGQDTYISNHSIEAAKQAITNICQAVSDLKFDIIDSAFCLSRPPGHHAEPNKAMGFCLFNNIYIGAIHAQRSGYQRVAILDFDVHHGNGTEEMFKKHMPENMLFISSYESPLYPWSDDKSTDIIHKHPLKAQTNGHAMRELYTEKILPTLKRFNPDLLLVSAGFDAHEADSHANLNWTADDYAWIGQQIRQYKTISILEGGYNLNALKDSVLAYINALDN